jgi:short-subunit dehydrogenase
VSPIDGGVVLVTGASSGIGRELARELSPRASALVLVARRRNRLEELAHELREQHPRLEVLVRACDLTDRDAAEAMVTEVVGATGHVDVLVNDAGVAVPGMYDRAPWTAIERMLELNVRALAWLTWRLVPAMVERRRGGVLNVSSGFGLTWAPGYAGYAGSKHFVVAFTECLRAELQDHGVVVSVVCPGPVATEAALGASEDRRRGRVPPFVIMSARACARAALAGFDRGQAVIIPGALNRAMLLLLALVPGSVFRRLAAAMARALRRRTGFHPSAAGAR